MNRNSATELARAKLNEFGLDNWKVKVKVDSKQSFLGLCIYKDKSIIINAHHVDLHPDAEVIDTILHEVAHALTPGHAHDEVWENKAKELGLKNPVACSFLNLPDYVIDAFRSGDTIEMTIEEEVTVIKKPKYKLSKYQEACPECGKPAKERFSFITADRDGNDCKWTTLECFHVTKKIIPRATPFETLVRNSWKPEIAACDHKWDKHQCRICGEFRLHPFQVIGANFIEKALALQKGAGIFDEYGLGKTVQSLAYLKYHSEAFPCLFVVKSAIKFQWLKQIIAWLGPEYMPQIIATGRDFVFTNLKCYIIAYDLLRRFPKEKLDKIGIKTIILDECQQIKNPDSTRTNEVRNLVKKPEVKVIPLSATPWKNRGSEFFPVLNMIDPIKFNSYQYYLDNWVQYYDDNGKRKEGGIRNPERFKEYIKDICIRREFNDVIEEYPAVNRMKIPMQLDELNQVAYDESESDFVKWYNQHVIDGTEDNISSIEILARMARMRHITGLAKIPATVSYTEDFLEDDKKKLVIFVHHKDVGLLLVDELKKLEYVKEHNIPIMSLTAEFSDGERFTIAETFNKLDKCLMVASTIASGEGVDLPTCNDSILHERQWNPQNEDQATPGRFKRIGQLANVINITVPEGEGTVDEDLDIIVERKRRQFQEAMDKNVTYAWNESDLAKELANRILEKHRKLNKGKEKSNKVISMAGRLKSKPLVQDELVNF
jgi:SNF2 family DNA or RNA helicase